MMEYTIGVSCIGSGVGQSVINSLRLSRLPLRTIGLGTNPFAYGAYDCDTYDYTKTIYAPDYIEDLLNKCVEHKIDLVIPGMDNEALIFSQNAQKFEEYGIKAIFASQELIELCRDKERMSHDLNPIADVFVKCYNKRTLESEIADGRTKFPLIAKPRSGNASKGIEILLDESDLKKVGDDLIIQELAVPNTKDPNKDYYISQIEKNINPQVSEISIQLVYSPDGELMGRMASYNKLNNGIPIEILPYEDAYVWEIIDKLAPHFLEMGLVGPLNIQGRLTDNGLKLFEMNPRFTGITGLRALMGFNEVEACVKEWLGLDKGKNQLRFNYNRFGIRQTADKSIPIERNQEVASFSERINGKILKPKKTVFITGACGYLGQNLISKLAINNEFNVWAFDLSKEKLKTLHAGTVENLYNIDDLNSGEVQLGNVDILLHLGFTRPHGTNEQIAQSLQFTNELFTRAVMHHVPAIINVSSQSVYGLKNKPLWTENTPVAPETVYAQAKYATELLLESIGKINNQIHYSSLRLGTLVGGAHGLAEVDFISKIVRKAIAGNTITIVGGMQEMERFDIRDAVSAILTMLKTDSDDWKPIYNLSSGEVLRLKEITKEIVNVVSKYNGGNKSVINIEPKEVKMSFGMDSTLFRTDIKWEPKYFMEDSIESLVKFFIN